MNKNSRLLIKMEATLFIVNRKEKRLIWKWKGSQSLSENKGSMVWWEINIKLSIINRGSCLCHYRTVSTRWPCFNNREKLITIWCNSLFYHKRNIFPPLRSEDFNPAPGDPKSCSAPNQTHLNQLIKDFRIAWKITGRGLEAGWKSILQDSGSSGDWRVGLHLLDACACSSTTYIVLRSQTSDWRLKVWNRCPLSLAKARPWGHLTDMSNNQS